MSGESLLGIVGAPVTLGILQADLFRILWEAGRPLTLREVYRAGTRLCRASGRDCQSITSYYAGLRRMSIAGTLIKTGSNTDANPWKFYPAFTRAQVMTAILNDVCIYLSGQQIGYILSMMESGDEGPLSDVAAALTGISKNNGEYDEIQGSTNP